jgi:hypothetical protein
MITKYWKAALVSLLFGVIGVVLALFAVHVYNDHQILHALLNNEIQRQKQNASPPNSGT